MRNLLIILLLSILLLPVCYLLVATVWELDSNQLAEAFYGRYLVSLGNSFLIAVSSAIGAMLIGLLVGWCLVRIRPPAGAVFEHLYLLPLLMPQYLVTIGWIYLLGQNGLLTKLITGILGVESLHFTIYGLPGVIFTLVLSYFPLVTLFVIAGLQNIDRTLEEAALLAASRFRTFLGVTLPLIAPYLLGGGILVFVLALSNFDVPSVLLVNVSQWEIFMHFSAFYNTPRAMVLAVPLVLTSLILVYLWYKLFSRRPLTTIGSATALGSKPPYPASALARWAALIFLLGLLILSVLLPLVTFIIQIPHWGVVFKTLLLVKEQLINSFWVAIVASLALVFLGIWFTVSPANLLGRRTSPSIILAAMLPLILPAAALGIGLIRVYNHGGLLGQIYQSSLISIIACVTRFMVIPLVIISVAYQNLDPTLFQASDVFGAPWYKKYGRIILPLMRRPILVSAVICFILTLSELGVTIMVNPPGFITLPVRIFSLYHFGADDQVASLCLIMSALVIGCYGVVSLISLGQIPSIKRGQGGV